MVKQLSMVIIRDIHFQTVKELLSEGNLRFAKKQTQECAKLQCFFRLNWFYDNDPLSQSGRLAAKGIRGKLLTHLHQRNVCFQSKHKLSAIKIVLKCSKPIDNKSLGVTSTTSLFFLPLCHWVSFSLHQWILTQGKLRTSLINSSPKSWVLIFRNSFTKLLDT